MELNQQSIHDVIHPTAAFSYLKSSRTSATRACCSPAGIGWEQSPLNPKNRIESLEPPRNPLWRVDGCTAFGTQFYAVPLFVGIVRPLRVDVFIPEHTTLPPDLRQLLDLDVTVYTRDGWRVRPLGIIAHLLRILQHWTTSHKHDAELFEGLPFGSRIVLHNLPVRIVDARITIAPTHHLERQLLSVASLQSYWGSELSLPPTVFLDEVEYVSQVHESVCLVRIQGKRWIFKALTSYTKYLYHELRQLLVTPPHPHVISRPAHLILKRCSFGCKTAVVGFTLMEHVHGSLRDLIPFLQVHGQVSMTDKIKWSTQLASALLHIHERASTFYPELRLDNIVLSKTREVVMIDFEQRGVWCEFAAPEVNAIEYIRLLAIDDQIESRVQEKYAALLTVLCPGWEKMEEGAAYQWPSRGYNIPWSCLTRSEQEACEVYMLGRVLWCIFEASSAPQRAAVWLSYEWEPLIEFPGYVLTPKPVQDLIDRCTRGRQSGLSRHIVRKRGKLVLRELEHIDNLCEAAQVQDVARAWWTREIRAAEDWLEERVEGMRDGSWRGNFYDRPTLHEVLDTLQDLSKGTEPLF